MRSAIAMTVRSGDARRVGRGTEQGHAETRQHAFDIVIIEVEREDLLALRPALLRHDGLEQYFLSPK